jgi:nitrite reductase/ring-hydroxylating ferredoxin subunit/uncharacterized membrane protein
MNSYRQHITGQFLTYWGKPKKENLMDVFEPEKVINRIPRFQESALAVSRGIHQKVLDGGEPARKAADLLHGTWLGHPAHPALTDFAISAWSMSGVLDVMAASSGSRVVARTADQLTALGIALAIPTAVTGLTDFTTIPRRATSTGAVHGLMNIIGLVLYILSWKNRRERRRSRGLFYSGLALGLLTISAWLGGKLTYRYGVGVNKLKKTDSPRDWTQVIAEEELPEDTLRRVEVEGEPVLLYRANGRVYAIGAVCAHEGGPLEQGRVDGTTVECPWHQSVYDLKDGRVVHGPATYAVPCFETRLRDGKVEIRLHERG